MSMRKLEYEVRFLTPAFLGNAEQNGQWRTPPFKALLRQWWRVAYAADHDFVVNVADIRRDEGMLFGNAWLSHKENGRDVADHTKSLVRIRLDHWKDGLEKKTKWGQQELQSGWKVPHPEVKQPVGPLLYLGYGPLVVTKTQPYATVLKGNAAIQADESAKLSLAVPEEHARLIEQALWLMDRYGTVGGRSRNGWGSFALTPVGDTLMLEGDVTSFARPWKDALEIDWPHAVGLGDDNKPFVWQTATADADWKTLMRVLAVIKIGLRTQFVFTTGQNAPQTESRHWLSYPVTKHNVAEWREPGRGELRLPNSLRFKVRKTAEGKLTGVIFHAPCLPSKAFRPDRAAVLDTWQTVHEFLDELTKPASSRSYTMIADGQRRAALKPSLDDVVLTRIAE